jgi:gliding motility-associated-like protein
MDFICDDKYVYLPNAFTPNGDGVNDVLLVRTSDKVQIYLAVFERWGEKVFETSDKNIGWDGKVNGKDADPAVFDYYLKAVCPGGQELFKKGNITLIR